MNDIFENLQAAGFNPITIDEDTLFPDTSLVVTIAILHKVDSDFLSTTVGEYQLAAVLEVPVNLMPHPIHGFLEFAFCYTQHVTEKGWTTHERVKQFWGPCRSSSVGDIFVINGRFFVVDSFGFKEVK